ncbi:chemotaxis protein [Novimethylophilus kurashikiensis]|uniref:Chemotaxis protein n=1 Tax=Novimethylophilus kurashikiensis TaxID=1825523 RepID=A0A2R5F907_9PROT|nr:DUF4262 domain-containing protein [Novimethylophilus kurashikiensis]GBG14515.1 chemotaxis protein [Novimethylophilus kurashikiensis]
MADHDHDEDCECCRLGPDEYLEQVEAIIEQYGLAVIPTGTECAGRPVKFSYTVGLSSQGMPELIVFSMPPDISQPILNHAANLLRKNALAFDEPVQFKFLPLPLVFKKVPAGAAEDFICVANVRAGEPLPAVQVVWCDADGNFPWQAGFDERAKFAQPLLFESMH